MIVTFEEKYLRDLYEKGTTYALLFEAALGIDAEIWIRMQAQYDMQIAKADKSFLERLANIRKIAAML